jgi:hypothetical protein
MKDLVPMNLIHVSMIQVLKVNTAIIRTYKLKFSFREHYLKLYLQKSSDIQQMIAEQFAGNHGHLQQAYMSAKLGEA